MDAATDGTSAADRLTTLGAAELARRIADGVVTSREVVHAYIERINAVNPALHALVETCFEQAREMAAAADRQVENEQLLGPLHGVPFTVKDCINVAGLPSTLGLSGRVSYLAGKDAQVVQCLRNAGGIVLGKTNLSQAMFFNECDNPVYGLTPHVSHAERTCGGSSGGEAAILAAGGSPLGIGTDLAGSIRVPAHFCGIHGLKPTAGAISLDGVVTNFPGMETIALTVGPMSRHVEDLVLALDVLSDANDEKRPGKREGYTEVNDLTGFRVRGKRIGVWPTDGFFEPSPAICRAVHEAAEVLAGLGAEIIEFRPSAIRDMVCNFFALLGADGGAQLKQLLKGEQVDPRIQKLLRLAALPGWLRAPLVAGLNWRGQRFFADMLGAARRRSTYGYWQLCSQAIQYRTGFWQAWTEAKLDAAICPPFGLAAIRHGDSTELIPAASYAFLPNLLGCPAGVVTTTRVGADEEYQHRDRVDRVEVRARQNEQGSVGLPIGVQVLAANWHDHDVLACMMALEPGVPV